MQKISPAVTHVLNEYFLFMWKMICPGTRIYFVVILFIIGESCLSSSLFAQDSQHEKPVFLYYGLGFGLNDYGVGVGVEKPLSKAVALYGNAGWGGWGMRYGTGLTFYPHSIDNKTGLSVGYSFATGIENHELKLSTTTHPQEQSLGIDFKALSTINVLLSRNYLIGHRSKLVWSVGYAFCLSATNYALKDSELELDEDARQRIKMLEPGGFIFGLRFMFGS